tara:strand:+ start:698 stop:1951 length:1254 start_codon:yes stop_codon:yes gene_type:complete
MTNSEAKSVASSTVRNRILGVLFIARGVIAAGYLASFTVLTIVGASLSGNAALAGIPAALVMVGRAIGPVPTARLMDSRGRRSAFVAGYTVGALGGLIAGVAVATESYALLLLGAFLLGVARASGDMARYAAAEIFPVEQRGRVIGLMVFAATVGAIGGPILVLATAGPAVALGLPEFSGPWFATSGMLVLASVITWIFVRPDPREISVSDGVSDEQGGLMTHRISKLLAQRSIQIGVLALLVGQAAMTLTMVVIPLHMHEGLHSTGAISIAMTCHVAGMFALSPLTGRMVDGFGAYPVVLMGAIMLILASILASLDSGLGAVLLGMFVLGYGWNACYVGGSSLLATGMPIGIRARLQGRIESVTAVVGALSSAVSGPLFVGGAGMGWVGVSGVGVAAILVVAVGWKRGLVRSTVEP